MQDWFVGRLIIFVRNVCVCVCCAPLFGNDEKNIFFLSLYRILEPKSNVRTYQTTNKCGQRNK